MTVGFEYAVAVGTNMAGGHASENSAVSIARSYYHAIDGGNYDRLASLLSPEFVHERPDMTLDGRDRFVAFMRDERPRTDTTHPIDGVYLAVDDGGPTTEVVVRGRLLGADGERIVGFVDIHRINGTTIDHLTTYSH